MVRRGFLVVVEGEAVRLVAVAQGVCPATRVSGVRVCQVRGLVFPVVAPAVRECRASALVVPGFRVAALVAA